MTVRPVEAPSYVVSTWVEVQNCVKVGKAFMLNCRFFTGIPWNVRVWFG